MKTEITETGWDEITTKKIHLGNEFENFTQNMTVKNWVEANKRLHLKNGFRSHCSCCKKKWIILSGNIHLFPSNKGNKLICDSCLKKLGK